MHWSRQYKVWPLSEFVHQNLGDDASKPEHRLLKPHLTEKVEMVTPSDIPMQERVREDKHHLGRDEREEKSSTVILPGRLVMMMKTMVMMKMMMSLMMETKVDLVLVEEKFQRSLLKPLRVSSMMTKIQRK